MGQFLYRKIQHAEKHNLGVSDPATCRYSLVNQLTLTGINIYPVKSCSGISLNSVQLDCFGPRGDRRWALLDDKGVAITQRDEAQLALIKTQLLPDTLILRLREECIEVPFPGKGAQKCQLRVWADEVSAVDAGQEAATWLSQNLGRKCRLAYIPDDSIRLVDGHYASAGETVGFADAFPILLISQASLDDLNSRLETAVPMNRFRPNLVVSGCEPFAEDRWKRIRVGEVEFDLIKPCDRCVMPSIDQNTAERDTKINRVLASYRRRDGKIYFGQNLLYQKMGKLHLSSPIEVIE
ncbi:MAG: hypothetical protein ACJAZE_000670 [Halioglobus sp.]|jgi:uncharacterized protein YcbX